MRRSIPALVLLLAACGDPGALPLAESQAGTRLTILSGPSPFAPGGCGLVTDPLYLAAAMDPYEFGDEADVSIAVDPADPEHLVAAWLQDAGLGILTAASFDGGRSWTTSILPALTHCQDMQQERAFHSRLSFGPDGLLYLGNEVDDGFFPDPRQLATIRIPVSVSRDGGLSWTTRFLDDELPDGPRGFSTLMAEPDVAGAAVVTWHLEGRVPGGTTYVSRTTDGGASWTRHTARQGLQGEFPFNRVLALRDGRLMLFSLDLLPTGIPAAAGVPGVPPASTTLFQQVSLDKGVTWTDPVAIGSGRGQQWPAAVESPTGTLFVGWLVDGADGVTQVVSRSDDRGATWSAPVVAAPTPDALHPMLALSGDGALGFAYTAPLPSGADARDLRFAQSADGGRTWTQSTLAGPMTLAAEDLGVFQETTGTPHGFAAVAPLGPPYARDGRTDVFYVEVRSSPVRP